MAGSRRISIGRTGGICHHPIVQGDARPYGFGKIACQIYFAIGVFASVVAAATISYWVVGWNVWDAFYMVIITVFGVGFGEVEPIDTVVERIITMLAIVGGSSATVYVVGSLIKVITEGEMQRAMQDHKKLKTIDELHHHTIICGFGRIGQTVARELAKAGQQFIVIDKDTERLAQAEQAGYLTISGDAGDEEILKTAHIDSATILAAVLPNDMVNVFITLTARDMNPELRIVARAENPASEKKLQQAGANDIVLPALAAGLHIAHQVTRPSMVNILHDSKQLLQRDLSEIGVSIEEKEITKGSPLIGKPLSEFLAPLAGQFVVLALHRLDGNVISNPSNDLRLESRDRLIVLARASEA